MNDENGRSYECKACGRFRNENIKPVCGDLVDFTARQGEYGFIENILPRMNVLSRPAVANIDILLIVVSAQKPHIDFMLVDKLLLQAQREGIRPVLCVNKTEAGLKAAREIERQYAAYDVLLVSAHEKTGLAALKELLFGKFVCFTGQSAVGKSSLINVIGAEKELEVGGMSKKTARGRHTTRTTELLYLPEYKAYVFDTPGFSMFDTKGVAREGLAGYYKEFAPYAGLCRFAGCAHNKEPDCAVKRAVEEGKIDEKRYQRYLKLLESFEGKENG